MKSWRGIPVLLSVLSGWVVGCGTALEGEAEAGAGVAAVALVPESEAAVDPVTAQGGLVPTGTGWDVCDDGAQRVRDIHPTGSSAPDELVDLDGVLLFVATDPEHGRELWVRRGQETSLLKDVWPGSPGSHPGSLTRVGTQVFFVANHEATGPELWRTDGTTQGTVLVKDIRQGRVGAIPEQLTVVGDTLYFVANDGEHGRELWRTDGTARGTEQVHDFAPGEQSADLDKLTAWEDGLALVHFDVQTYKSTLLSIDRKGRVRPLYTLDSGLFLDLEAAGRQLFFTVLVGSSEEADLWVTRDAPRTATWLRHFPGQQPAYLTAMGDAVYFVAGGQGDFGEPGDSVHGSELWTSDGTVRGTRMVRDIEPGDGSAFSSYDAPGFVVVDRTLYFAAYHHDYGRELWRSDGTPWGTWLVGDLEPGEGSSDPMDLTAENGWLFFSATTSGHGREAWYSTGRPWNTRQLMDVATGPRDSVPGSFTRSGWDVYFTASDSTGDKELWSVPFRPLWFCGEQGR